MLTIVAATLLMTPTLVAFRPNLMITQQPVVLEYDNISAPGTTEVIPTINVSHGEMVKVNVEVRVSKSPTWYSFGSWTLAGTGRSSVNSADDNGKVLTDTLRLKMPADSFDVRLTMSASAGGPAPVLKLLALCFSSVSNSEYSSAPSPAWSKLIDVPQLAQGNYPNGGVLCSPTSLCMLLQHYSIDKDVPEVQKNVWDPVYDGAGNWAFNAAYAGSLDGMLSYVTRLNSIADLENWIAAGYPVICSAPLDLLNGEEHKDNTGHLVVLVGFTATGDPIFNDPAKRDQVRRTYLRANFDKAWKYSGRTVYIVTPENAIPPKNSHGAWIE